MCMRVHTRYSKYALEMECSIAMENWKSISKSALLCCHMRSEGVGDIVTGCNLGTVTRDLSSGDTWRGRCHNVTSRDLEYPLPRK